MLLLAIECSTRQGSVALLENHRLLAEESWGGPVVRHGVLFDHLTRLMESTGKGLKEIERIAVGRGPGSFSGIRMSLAAAQALALPGETPVQAVSSGAALALQVADAATPGAMPRSIAVAGDARRGQLWIGWFECLSSAPCPIRPRSTQGYSDVWQLVPYDALDLPAGTRVVSSEADRLQRWIPDIESAFPTARDIGRLALLQETAEPLEALYLHPPVHATHGATSLS